MKVWYKNPNIRLIHPVWSNTAFIVYLLPVNVRDAPFQGSPSRKRTLAQVFSEQDAAIRSIVDKQHRHYSTDSAPKSGEVTLSQRERLKKAVKEYGSTVIVFHISISLMSLGGFYLAVSRWLAKHTYCICSEIRWIFQFPPFKTDILVCHAYKLNLNFKTSAEMPTS